MNEILRAVIWFVRQPLFHFLVIGAALFAIDAARNPSRSPADIQIKVGEAEITWMIANWRAQFGRLPTSVELESEINTWVSDQMRYREALALKLDLGDSIVQRRLVQKYDFLFPPENEIGKLDDTTLRTYYEDHKDRFMTEWTVSFCHVFFDTGSNRATALSRAKAAIGKVGGLAATDAKLVQIGDDFPHENCYEGARDPALRKDFGDFFVGALKEIPTGKLVGPVESGLGFHLVLIDQRIPPKQMSYEEAGPIVRSDWRDSQIEQAKKAQDARLRARYNPIVESGAVVRALENAP